VAIPAANKVRVLQLRLQPAKELVDAPAVDAKVVLAHAARAADEEGAIAPGVAMRLDGNVHVVFEDQRDAKDGAHAPVGRLYVHLDRPHGGEYGLHGAKQQLGVVCE